MTSWKSIVAVTCIVLAYSSAADAQSVIDGFDPGANGIIRAFAVQADGKIVVGGDFTTLGGGGTGTTPRHHLGRLNPDGTVDATFTPSVNGTVFALAIQADGKILVGGLFGTLGGQTRNYLGRLNSDGSVDMSFDPGADAYVLSLAVQLDGKILVGGYFEGLGGGTGTTPRHHIGRLNANGSVDATFDPGANDAVLSLAIQKDGKIVVGGVFTTLGGGGTGTSTRNLIGRLLANGTLDGFNPGANDAVSCLAVQPDGRILAGGAFTKFGGGGTTTRNHLARVKADGSLDTEFDPGANAQVIALALQPDGKIVVGGFFTTLGGGGAGTFPRNYLGRIGRDGSLEVTFSPTPNSPVYALALQADAKIVAGGSFTTLAAGFAVRNRIGRLYPEGFVDRTLISSADGGV
jgi:uncharacterized delta-60 repeat protein